MTFPQIRGATLGRKEPENGGVQIRGCADQRLAASSVEGSALADQR